MSSRSWHSSRCLLGVGIALAQIALASDFSAAVSSTHPIAFYHLNGTDSGLRPQGPVQFHDGARLNGRDAYIVTPQKGGIGRPPASWHG